MVLIEVKRVRASVTQGTAEVWINGERVISFDDPIGMVLPNEKYYGEDIGGYASLKSDSDFINGLFWHPHDNVYHHSELAKAAIIKADNYNGKE